MIEKSVTAIGAGFVLTVERNLEEPDVEAGIVFEPGCRIALTRLPQIDFAQLAIDLTQVNVLAPPDASVSIYFNAADMFDGYSMQAFPDIEPTRLQ